MPSPFPGMDPFVTAAEHWPTLHDGLAAFICAAVNRDLPRRYSADLRSRTVTVEPDAAYIPNVAIAIRRQPPRGTDHRGTAVADEPLIVRMPEAFETRENYVDIVIPRENNKLVASIEILSPTSKNPGRGRDEYLKKQAGMLASTAHLLEVDLLRDGQHTLAAGAGLVRTGEFIHGAACLHRALGKDFAIWPIGMTRRLPRVAVPLTGDDADITLDLHAVFTRTYDELAFDRRVNYAARLPGTMSFQEVAWIDELLSKHPDRLAALGIAVSS